MNLTPEELERTAVQTLEHYDRRAQAFWEGTRDHDVSQNIAALRAKPSTLQDVLAGKTLEIDALLGQTQAFAREEGIATPVIDVCVPLLRGLDASLRAK